MKTQYKGTVGYTDEVSSLRDTLVLLEAQWELMQHTRHIWKLEDWISQVQRKILSLEQGVSKAG